MKNKNLTIEEQVIELINEYDLYFGNNRKGGAILNKLSNLLFDYKSSELNSFENNEIINISGRFAYFREHRMKAYHQSLQWDIRTLKKYFGN